MTPDRKTREWTSNRRWLRENRKTSEEEITVPIKASFNTLFRQHRMLPDMPQTRLNHFHRVTEQQRSQFENLRYISLLFYVPIILILFYFWI